MRFSTKFFLGASAIVLLATAITVVGVRSLLRTALVDQFTVELERQVRLVAVAVDSNSRELNADARRFGALLGRRVTFIDSTGRVVGDSDFDDVSLRLLEDHSTRPETQSALQDGLGVDRRVSASTNRSELKVAVPGWPGVVRVSAPEDQIDRLLGRATNGALLAGLISIVFGVGLAAILNRTISKPVREMARASRAVAAGKTPVYPVSNTREIRDLVRSVRSMHQDLDARISELEAERGETTTMLEVMIQGVLVTDERGSVTLCNRAMRSLLGYQEQQPIPDLAELFHEREAREIVERAIGGETVLAVEVVIDDRTVLMTARPLPNGGTMLGLLDLTEVKRVQEVRRDFVANVSHELKTPLTSILGYSDTLLKDQPDEETTRSFLATIHRNANRMQSLVDDLLSLALVESGAWKPRPELVDITATATETWRALVDRATQKEIQFAVTGEPGLTVMTDRGALQQIMTNLLDNALRHSDHKGTIRLTAARRGEWIALTISDNGSGIPSEHLARVFERFYRADPGRSREEGGTGLGLAIVKHMVETLGGEIELTSELGRGTNVVVKLPNQAVR